MIVGCLYSLKLLPQLDDSIFFFVFNLSSLHVVNKFTKSLVEQLNVLEGERFVNSAILTLVVLKGLIRHSRVDLKWTTIAHLIFKFRLLLRCPIRYACLRFLGDSLLEAVELQISEPEDTLAC